MTHCTLKTMDKSNRIIIVQTIVRNNRTSLYIQTVSPIDLKYQKFITASHFLDINVITKSNKIEYNIYTK